MISEEILKKIKPGAKVKVFEGTTPFEGLVLARKHGKETGATFTVRANVAGVGVEKVFPINVPTITKIEVLSSPKKVHRSKLYFVRGMAGHRVRKKIGVSV
ncbi:MAG: large subunit ribosomal protein L19 [Parcubacteria group bacterium LiPW_15]|nr:MAG: large subunit ribosomal protein L19 [Parcubacteria group bacterium LiPW_15]